MADETPAPAVTPTPGSVTDAGGGTIRVTPGQTPGSEGPTLEEQAAALDETPEQKGAREAAEAAGGDKAPEDKPEGDDTNKTPEAIDLKGTVFEGLSPEMQTKVGPFAAAFAANGTLTDAEVTEAANATGFSEAAVRQFMAGAQATAVQSAAPIFAAAGGEDQFKQFQAWSNQPNNLTDAEEKAYTKAINAGDNETAAVIIAPAIERWKASGDGPPARDVTNTAQGATTGSSGDVYANWDQVQADMKKPEYRTDAAFRSKVEAKMARSPNI